MKTFVLAAICAVIIFSMPITVSAQSGVSPKKVLEALAGREFKHALDLAGKVDEPN